VQLLARFDRGKLTQPEVMAPLIRLVSDAAGNVTGRRFLGVHWDAALPSEEAAEKAGAPVAWTSIATMTNHSEPLLADFRVPMSSKCAASLARRYLSKR
jgi:hypothetical protein